MNGIIFDMDGVLIDSLPLHTEADTQLFNWLNIDITGVDFSPYYGMSNPEIWALVIKNYGITMPLAEILKRSLALKLKLLNAREFTSIKGIPELLAALNNAGIPCAVASSSSPYFIDAVLKKLAIGSFFSAVVSGESVAKSKPDPDIFLKAAELLDVVPENCVVIEDSGNGVVAAKRAGMKCVAFKNPTSGNQDISQADLSTDQFSELPVKRILSLFKQAA
ncbi:MAG: HAD family hydrolase [Treponema sp.]|jgi:HAD superfamily hydrolase (TIGR01509 family)|nr:HAD family hydrolase [Treponema sp.]